MSETPTKREAKAITFGVFNFIESHAQALQDATDYFGGEEELNRRFAPGPESFGQHEALDRAFMLAETWEHYVETHPTILLIPEAHRMACIVTALMHEVYQVVAAAEDLQVRQEG